MYIRRLARILMQIQALGVAQIHPIRNRNKAYRIHRLPSHSPPRSPAQIHFWNPFLLLLRPQLGFPVSLFGGGKGECHAGAQEQGTSLQDLQILSLPCSFAFDTLGFLAIVVDFLLVYPL